MTGRPDAIDFLLGELSPDGMREAERLMREDPAFRDEVDRLRPVVGGLEDLPREAWERLEPPPLVLPVEPPRPGLVSRLRAAVAGDGMRMGAVAFAVVAALAVGVGIGALATRGGDDATGGATAEQTITLAALPDAPGASGHATVLAVDGHQELEVDVSGLPPSSAGDVYELWLLNSPEDLVSLGTFRVPESGAATVRVPLSVPPDRFAAVDISVEPLGGSPTHSGKSVLRAET